MRHSSPDKFNKGGLTRRELLSSEKGTIHKKWGSKVPVCVVYPNIYHIGMSNLAVHILYSILNAMPDVVCERAFFNEQEEVRSIESNRPLSSFECVFFTVSFELDYINIVNILRLSSITHASGQRKEREPLIIAGGICVMSNPEPIHSFFDLFLMGDIEVTVPDFMERYMALREKKRDDVLNELSAFPWAYNPKQLSVQYGDDGTIQTFTPASFSVTPRHYKGEHLGVSAVIAEETEFSNMFLVEGTRGCPSQCPFCLLGNTYRFSYDSIVPLTTRADDVGIIGGGVSFHPSIVNIVKELKAAGKRVHFPSLRIDETPLSLIELMEDEIKTLTFGIEAGTEKLRQSIGKPLTDEALFAKMDSILAIKPFNLKLYFMIGLYGETLSDIEGIVNLVKHVKHIMVKRGAKRGFVGSITVHASPFVPKPSTPFQWLPMQDMGEMKNKIGWLKRELGKADNTYFTHESLKYSLLQGVLSRGDRRLNDVILRLARGENFSRIMKESPVNLNFYVLRGRGRDEIFPWDFIAGKPPKNKLYERYITSIL